MARCERCEGCISQWDVGNCPYCNYPDEKKNMNDPKYMTIGERIRYVKDEIVDAYKKIGSPNCPIIQTAYENGKIDRLKEELQWLEALYDGKMAKDE